MVEIFRASIGAEELKGKARALGADLVGIADGKVMDAYPPDPRDPRRPCDITALDADRVIVLGKHYTSGTTRLSRWNIRWVGPDGYQQLVARQLQAFKKRQAELARAATHPADE